MIIRTVKSSAGRRRLGATLAAGALALALAGCSTSTDTGGATTSAADGTIQVLASTSVWGDVARQVGGEHVEVTSVISDPSADPHAFQSNARDQLALSKAALVIENGGGYDDFMQTMLASASSTAPVINAVQTSGFTATEGELNEHVWYDLPTAGKVADAIAAELGSMDPADAGTFTANAAAFTKSLAGLSAQVEQIKAAHGGTAVAITEPVPLHLIEAAGLENVTPAEFSDAIENETDVPAGVMDQTLKLFTDGRVAALVNNEQTTGPQTGAVVAAATAAGIPVVSVTETLPDGQDYLSWMQANVQALSGALAG